MTALAAIYVRRGRVFVVASSQTVDGFWVETDPRYKSDEFDAAEATACLVEALDGSHLDVPTPPRDSPVTQLPALAGVKSYATFMKGAVSVQVYRCGDGTLTITPMRNAGARGGFVPIVEHEVEVESGDQLTSALVAALENAE